MVDTARLVVTIDGSPAEAGAARVNRAIDGMKSSALNAFAQMGNKYQSMMNMIKSASNSNLFGGMSSAVSNVGATISSMVGGSIAQLKNLGNHAKRLGEDFGFSAGKIKLAMLAIAAGSAYAAKSMLDRMIEVNNTYTAFIATMGVVTGSVAKSEAEYQYLLDFANKIGVSIESVTQQYGRLAASMKSVDSTGQTTRHVFEAIAEASTVLHLRGYETNFMFMALEQAASKGKVSLEEFQRQLANRLPDAMGLASRAMSMTQAEFREAVTAGSLDVYEVITKLSNQIKKEYSSAAEYAATMFNASMNKMQNSVFELYRVVGQSGAMDGLNKILDSLNKKMTNSGWAEGIGKSLGGLFNDLAGWIDQLSDSDIYDFFMGLSGAIQVFTDIMYELVIAFSTTTDGKAAFMSFGEGVASAFILMTDMALTFVSAIMEIPLAVSAVMKDVQYMFAWLDSTVGSLLGTGAAGAWGKNIGTISQERNSAVSKFNMNNSILFGTSDSPTAKAWSKKDEIFNGMRNNKPSSFSRSNGSQVNLAPLSDEQLSRMGAGRPQPSSGGGGGRRGGGGGGRSGSRGGGSVDEFTKASLDMTNARVKAEMELDDIQNDRLGTEYKYRNEMEIKLVTDKKMVALSYAKKDSLMAQAEAADVANSALESLRRTTDYHNETMSQSKEIEQKMFQYAKNGELSNYNEELKLNISFLKGGSNEIVNQTDKVRMLSDARKRDYMQRQLDSIKLSAESKKGNDDLLFEASNLGLTSVQIQYMTEARRIDLEIKRLSASATGEELNQYTALGQFLKSDYAATLDKIKAKQDDLSLGAKDGVAKYMDSVANGAEMMSNAVNNSLNHVSDALVNMFTTGEFSFKSLAKSILAELIKVTVQLLIMKPLITMFSSMFGGGVSGSVTPSANGNVFDYGGLKAFASGGAFTNSLVSSPTLFPMGLMGEAGPEAIMPLSRDSKGRLGVSGGGSNLQQINQISIEINTDVHQGGSTQSSQSSNDTTKQYDKFASLIKAKVQEVIIEEKRQGGSLYAGG